MGFYYIYNAIRGEADPPRYSPKGPNGRPPRTNQDTNASQWPTAGDFWKDYYATGFNTFTLGWMGSAWLEGYGQMLDYLQIELGTGIMPILNVGNTQEVINAHPPKWTAPASRPNARASLRSTEDGAPPSAAVVQAKANAAGSMARTFANASILAYYIFDEVGPGSMVVDGAVTSAVRGNDSYHPTFSLVCGVQCAGSADSLNARRYAERHQVSAIDSYTEYMRNVSVSPRFIAQDIKMARAAAPAGQPVIAVLQAVVIFIMECKPENPHRLAGCEKYRPILPAEARCEAFLAIVSGATGLLYFDWGPTITSTPQNTSASFLIDEMPDVWEELRSIATEVRDLAPVIVGGRPPPFAAQVTATGADSRLAEGGGPYSTWTALDVGVWQNSSTLLVVVVSTVPRPLKSVVIDLTSLTETLLRPNATVAVDLGRRGKLHDQVAEHALNRTVSMVHWKIADTNFSGPYGVHHYTVPLDGSTTAPSVAVV